MQYWPDFNAILACLNAIFLACPIVAKVPKHRNTAHKLPHSSLIFNREAGKANSPKPYGRITAKE